MGPFFFRAFVKTYDMKLHLLYEGWDELGLTDPGVSVTSRLVVIVAGGFEPDEDVEDWKERSPEPPYAIPCDDEADARDVIIGLLRRSGIVDLNSPDDESVEFSRGAPKGAGSLISKALNIPVDTNLDDLSVDRLGDIHPNILVVDEGASGVWSGFCTSDRQYIGGPWPGEDDYFGGGDETVYFTVGKSSGVIVAGVEMPIVSVMA